MNLANVKALTSLVTDILRPEDFCTGEYFCGMIAKELAARGVLAPSVPAPPSEALEAVKLAERLALRLDPIGQRDLFDIADALCKTLVRLARKVEA